MHFCEYMFCRGQLKCDGIRAETRFRLSAKRTNPFKSAGGVSSVDCWQPRCAPWAVVMLDTQCSEVVWRVLATHCIRQFSLHFPSRAATCAIAFQLESISAASDLLHTKPKTCKMQGEIFKASRTRNLQMECLKFWRRLLLDSYELQLWTETCRFVPECTCVRVTSYNKTN